MAPKPECLGKRNALPPDRLVGEPPGVTLVEAVLVSGSQLLGRGDCGAGSLACLHSCGEIQRVAAGVGPVVEHHTWTQGTKIITSGGEQHFFNTAASH